MEASGYGGSIDSHPVSIDSFEIVNCVKISNITAMAVDLPQSSERTPGGPISGYVGYDLLSRYVVQIDYETNKITLIDPNTFKPDFSYGTPLPVQLDGDVPKIPAQLDNLPSATYLVDTGDNSGLRLNWPYVKAHKLRAIYTHGVEEAGGGIGGLSFSWGTHVGAFTIAGSTLKDVPAEFSQDTKGDGSVLEAGAIGGALLSHFIVTFDYPHNRLYLKLNPLAGTFTTKIGQHSASPASMR